MARTVQFARYASEALRRSPALPVDGVPVGKCDTLAQLAVSLLCQPRHITLFDRLVLGCIEMDFAMKYALFSIFQNLQNNSAA